jgi:hypothetical protein
MTIIAGAIERLVDWLCASICVITNDFALSSWISSVGIQGSAISFAFSQLLQPSHICIEKNFKIKKKIIYIYIYRKYRSQMHCQQLFCLAWPLPLNVGIESFPSNGCLIQKMCSSSLHS